MSKVKAASKYYTLLVMVDGKWSIHFGDYSHAVVKQEREDVKDSGEYKRTQIVMTSADQPSIDSHVASLNAQGF